MTMGEIISDNTPDNISRFSLNKGRPIVFGEVLFDCFPDGHSVLGGAPFNVAWHLQGFGYSPVMVSCVGTDANGDKVRKSMREWKMDVSGVQVSDCYPTGQVAVELENGQPRYDIVTDQAYDHIDAQAAALAIESLSPSMIYHGSLALRGEQSQEALDDLVRRTQVPIFLDLNLRAPWWESALVDDVLHRATWVKLNDEELCEVTHHTLCSGIELQHYAQELFEKCELERLIVTLGAQGAFVVSKEGIAEGQPVPVEDIADTVGAGDAFSAVTIAGILQGKSIQSTLDQALSFASAVCQQRGATANNPTLYRA